jgi:hypothetical protein
MPLRLPPSGRLAAIELIDYDPGAARSGHPAVHLTLNSTGCRIGCAAPLHVLRFVDFIFRHFYGDLWAAHASFFRDGARKHIGRGSLTIEERLDLHLMWDFGSALRAAGGGGAETTV